MDVNSRNNYAENNQRQRCSGYKGRMIKRTDCLVYPAETRTLPSITMTAVGITVSELLWNHSTFVL